MPCDVSFWSVSAGGRRSGDRTRRANGKRGIYATRAVEKKNINKRKMRALSSHTVTQSLTGLYTAALGSLFQARAPLHIAHLSRLVRHAPPLSHASRKHSRALQRGTPPTGHTAPPRASATPTPARAHSHNNRSDKRHSKGRLPKSEVACAPGRAHNIPTHHATTATATMDHARMSAVMAHPHPQTTHRPTRASPRVCPRAPLEGRAAPSQSTAAAARRAALALLRGALARWGTTRMTIHLNSFALACGGDGRSDSSSSRRGASTRSIRAHACIRPRLGCGR